MSTLMTLDERQALKDEALKWAFAAYGDSRRRAAQDRPEGFDPEAWRELAELGWLGLAIPEEQGGAGAGFAELASVAQAVGAGLLAEPVSMVAGPLPALIMALGSAAQQAEDLPRLAAGELLASLAHYEPDGGFDRDSIATRAEPNGAGLVLSGAKSAVVAAEAAEVFYVSARDPAGRLGLYRVPAATSGVTVTGFRAIDGRRLGDLALAGVHLPPDARLGEDAGPALDAALDLSALLSAAEAVGAMERLLDETTAYLRTRQQFGRPLSSFQALQHRVVDLYIGLQEARGTLEVASRSLSEPAAARQEAICLACIAAGRAGQAIGRESIQLHGGMGMTDELIVGHLFKRLLVATSQYGDQAYYRRRYQALGGNQNS